MVGARVVLYNEVLDAAQPVPDMPRAVEDAWRRKVTDIPREQDDLAAPADMADVQSDNDARRIAINKVGVKDITYPITLHCPVTGGVQHTVATVNMYVGLPHHQKGTHMSRFLEVLNRHHEELRSDQIMAVCRDMRHCLEAEEAHLELRFPYFIHKTAPITGAPGMVDIQVTFEASSSSVTGEDTFIMGMKVPAMSVVATAPSPGIIIPSFPFAGSIFFLRLVFPILVSFLFLFTACFSFFPLHNPHGHDQRNP